MKSFYTNDFVVFRFVINGWFVSKSYCSNELEILRKNINVYFKSNEDEIVAVTLLCLTCQFCPFIFFIFFFNLLIRWQIVSQFKQDLLLFGPYFYDFSYFTMIESHCICWKCVFEFLCKNGMVVQCQAGENEPSLGHMQLVSQ